MQSLQGDTGDIFPTVRVRPSFIACHSLFLSATDNLFVGKTRAPITADGRTDGRTDRRVREGDADACRRRRRHKEGGTRDDIVSTLADRAVALI